MSMLKRTERALKHTPGTKNQRLALLSMKYVVKEPIMVAIPIKRGTELDNPAAQTPPRMNIWNNMSVNPATKVTPILDIITLPGAWNNSLKFLSTDSPLLGGMAELPKMRAQISVHRNLNPMKWK